MNATLHTFPPFHAMTSPRGWILAAIVLLHFGFFVLLSSGMGGQIVQALRPATVMITLPTPVDREQPLPRQPVDVTIERIEDVFVPRPELPPLPTEEAPESTVRTALTTEPPPGAMDSHERSADPIMLAPRIDPRIGLSEPPYPASEIRANNTGTVLLSIYVLENGRVGDVRLDQSSGHPKLDESALREARQWRLQPGMRDGVPVAMWKQIPITFQLQGGKRF